MSDKGNSNLLIAFRVSEKRKPIEIDSDGMHLSWEVKADWLTATWMKFDDKGKPTLFVKKLAVPRSIIQYAEEIKETTNDG